MTTIKRHNIKIIPCDWTSDGSGDATVDIPDHTGYLIASVRSAPGEEGDLATDLPTNLYGITLINDLTGEDVLAGEGADRSGTVADVALIGDPPPPVPGAMTLTIAAAGDTKQGRVYLSLLVT